MKKINWSVVTIVGIIVILFLLGTGLFGGWGYHGWGMMGPGMMGWGHPPFGWIGMIFMWLIPLGFLVLTILGIIWLAQNLGSPRPPVSAHVCPKCGKGVQVDWQNCPYCGTPLK